MPLPPGFSSALSSASGALSPPEATLRPSSTTFEALLHALGGLIERLDGLRAQLQRVAVALAFDRETAPPCRLQQLRGSAPGSRRRSPPRTGRSARRTWRRRTCCPSASGARARRRRRRQAGPATAPRSARASSSAYEMDAELGEHGWRRHRADGPRGRSRPPRTRAAAAPSASRASRGGCPSAAAPARRRRTGRRCPAPRWPPSRLAKASIGSTLPCTSARLGSQAVEGAGGAERLQRPLVERLRCCSGRRNRTGP